MKLTVVSVVALSLDVVSVFADSSSSVSVTLPGTTFDGPTTAAYTYAFPNDTIDASKLQNINSTAFGDLWYFDAISPTDPNVAVLVAFVASASAGYIPWTTPPHNTTTNITSLLSVQGAVQLANETYTFISPWADSAELTYKGLGTSGVWSGTGASWSDAEDLSTVTLTFVEPFAITGTIVLERVSASHLECFM